MNTRILLLAMSVMALSSCSVYKTGQTPDDVYYSSTPARVQKQQTQSDGDYLDVNQQKAGTNYQTYDQYQDGVRDDRFLRMSVDNPDYMYTYNNYSAFDWRYNSYYDGFNYGYSSPWNNYFAWNNFYNPYYSGFGLSFSSYGYYGSGFYSGGGGGVKSVASATPISRPVSFNVNSYTNTNRPAGRPYLNGSYNNTNARYNNSNGNNGRTNSYYNNNNNNGRSSYTPSNSNSNNSSSAPSRSYAPASSGSSSSGGGGGGGISRPGRN